VHVHLLGPEGRLQGERAPGPALAREAVAHRDDEGIALDLEPKLSAVTCRFPGRHSRHASERSRSFADAVRPAGLLDDP
jgi:hypothetical protein